MESFSYQIKLLSSLILSPRATAAFYGDLKDFDSQDIKPDTKFLEPGKLKVIYPFYQYGTYASYDPAGAEYYLPGSSIKGAICQGNAVESLMVDDIRIPNPAIDLRHIFKAQYLDNTEQACFTIFFDHIGVEMVRAGTILNSVFNADCHDTAVSLLKTANASTKVKMGQMKDYLHELGKRNYGKELQNILQSAYKKLTSLLENDDVLLLGGYKGLLHSMVIKEPFAEAAGAIYLDPETDLPHGLVEMKLQ